MTTPPATQSRQMSTPTIHQLLEQVTPGEWKIGDYALSSIYASFPDSPGNPVMIADTKNRNHAANALYIARLNPAVMKVVVEALELAAKGDTSQTCSPGNESIVVAAMDALKALNAQP